VKEWLLKKGLALLNLSFFEVYGAALSATEVYRHVSSGNAFCETNSLLKEFTSKLAARIETLKNPFLLFL
jgi:hypothetical protein